MKRIETIGDLLTAVAVCPTLRNALLVTNEFDEGFFTDIYKDADLGIFFDEQKGEVFHAYTVYAAEDDMTFIMKEFYDVVDMQWRINSVFDFHFGSPEKNEAEYYILKVKPNE